MVYNKENVFAKILKKELPAERVYENNYVLAFKTIKPMADTHILVIPKGEFVSYNDFVGKASNVEIVEFFKAIDIIAQELKIDDSYKLVMNHGKAVGQEVFHFHVHLMHGKIKPV